MHRVLCKGNRSLHNCTYLCCMCVCIHVHTCVCEIVKTGKQRVSAEQRTYTDDLAQHKAGSAICLVQGGPVPLDVLP